MVTYLAILALLILLRVAGQTPELQRQIYWLILLGLFIFSAFRFEVGCDWGGYLYQWQRQEGEGLVAALENRDPLWWALIEMIQRAGLPYPFINVFSSAIFFFGVHRMARRQTDPIGFLALIFPFLILTMPMSGVRQASAIGIICLAYNAFVDRRPLRFFFLTAMASGLHGSAMTFFLLTPLVGHHSRARAVLAVLIAIPAAFFLISSTHADIAVSRYMSSEIDALGATYRTGLLFISGLIFFLFLRKQWQVICRGDYYLAFFGAMAMVTVFPLAAVSSVIADRLAYYLIPVQSMIFSRIRYLQGEAGRQLSVAVYCGISFVFVVWTATSSHFQSCYTPYQTWLF